MRVKYCHFIGFHRLYPVTCSETEQTMKLWRWNGLLPFRVLGSSLRYHSTNAPYSHVFVWYLSHVKSNK